MNIISISLTRMTNEVHVQFHVSVATLMERLDLPTMGLEPLCNLYKQTLANEQEALLIITKSERTTLISVQDRVRDAIFRGLSDTVKGLRNHFDAQMRNDANRLWAVFLHYGNITVKTFDAQTAATSDMLREFKRPELQQAIVNLKLTDWVEKLDEENQKFHQLMMLRYNEPVGQTTFRMKTARKETDKYYRAITAHVDNLLLTGNNEPAMNDIADFVTELNAIIRRFKNIMAQQLGKKAEKNEKL